MTEALQTQWYSNTSFLVTGYADPLLTQGITAPKFDPSYGGRLVWKRKC
ncbi:MAG: hypothetical protein RBJ76_06265 [Stenomitos frigidus ULC029]